MSASHILKLYNPKHPVYICRDFPNRCEAYFIVLDRLSPVAGLQLMRYTHIDKWADVRMGKSSAVVLV